MAWYMAKSLEVLRGQLDTLAPHRSKVSDGGIGDTAHSARTSDHNPIAGTGQVCARDFTHDPAGGLDCHWLARVLIGSGDGRIKYIIWDGRWWRPGIGWKTYTGDNPHTKHLHLSVFSGSTGDQTRAWNLGAPGQSGDKDLNANQELMLKRIHEQLTGTQDPAKGWPGYPSLEYPWVKSTPVDFIRAMDQNVIRMNRAIAAIGSNIAKINGVDPKEVAAALLPDVLATVKEQLANVDNLDEAAVADRLAENLAGRLAQ
jgi:hypothetical protein